MLSLGVIVFVIPLDLEGVTQSVLVGVCRLALGVVYPSAKAVAFRSAQAVVNL